MILLFLSLTLVIVYAVIQFQYVLYWHRIPQCGSPQSQLTGVSIIVVVRNGAATINRCITGILHQHYPAHLSELLVIDDHSSDATASLIRQQHDTRVRFLQLAQFPDYIHAPAFKKSAIHLGVDHAKHDLIIVTDADCLHPMNWLRTVVHCFEKSNAAFQTAPVLLLPGQSMLIRMQEMELLALMLITGSAIHSRLHDMANGANMAFSKQAFLQVNGYEGNWNHPSGDDMFLIEKMRNTFPDQVCYAKMVEATVLTTGHDNWSALIAQRMRWSAKNAALQNKRISAIWLIVGLYHIMLLFLLIMAIASILSWWPFLIMLTSKWICDLALLYPAAQFFRKESLLRYFIPLQFMYGVYILRAGWAMIAGKKGDWRTQM